MFKRLITIWKTKRMAAQLRKPTGHNGQKTGDMMNKANATLYDFTLRCMQLKGQEDVLEIGFGNGKLFHKLFEKHQHLKVTGLDYAADMVKTAHAHNREYLQTGRLNLVNGSSDRMPFPDAAFDVIFCINVIYFWDDPSAHLREIKRVLKPGGRFFATIRKKDSLDQMPFAQYGFTKWTPALWKENLHTNGLELQQEYAYSEEAVLFKGEMVQLESICLEAGKR